MFDVSQLVIEVTRRCNMTCGHCLRGDAQNLDMSLQMIEKIIDSIDNVCTVTFTGGEPTLNLDAIEHYFEYALEKDKLPSAFYLVTNGTGDQLRLATLLLKYYPYMQEQCVCGVSLSVDEFHETPFVPSEAIIKALVFYDASKETDYKGSQLIAEGRSANIKDARPFEPDDDFSISGYNKNFIGLEMVYVAANGNLYQDCDASYARVDKESKYNINDMPAFMQHILQTAEEGI